MTITIGKSRFATRKPRNLDEQLIATTGCSAAENLLFLTGQPLPGRVAAAIAPFLGDDAPPLAELAVMIEAEIAMDGSTLLRDVRQLFAAAEIEPEKPSEESA